MIILHCTMSTGRYRAGRLDTATMVSCVSVHLVPGVTLHCTWPRQPPEPTYAQSLAVMLGTCESFEGSPLRGRISRVPYAE